MNLKQNKNGKKARKAKKAKERSRVAQNNGNVARRKTDATTMLGNIAEYGRNTTESAYQHCVKRQSKAKKKAEHKQGTNEAQRAEGRTGKHEFPKKDENLWFKGSSQNMSTTQKNKGLHCHL